MMLIVPLQAVQSQAITTSLGGQTCQINVYQKFWGLFLDLYVDNVLIISGVVCLNKHLCVISTYLGFVGDLMWNDTRGTADPDYLGLVDRFQLQYLDAADVIGLGLLFTIGVS